MMNDLSGCTNVFVFSVTKGIRNGLYDIICLLEQNNGIVMIENYLWR